MPRVTRNPDGTPVIHVDAGEGDAWTRDPEVVEAIRPLVEGAVTRMEERMVEQRVVILEGYHASEELQAIAEELIATHDRFRAIGDHNGTYALLWGKEVEDGTLHAMARFVKAPALWRDLAGVEFVVWVNQKAWVLLDEQARRAIVAHELCHFGENEQGDVKVLDHDVEEFVFVARQFGAWKGSLGQLRLALEEGPQAGR